MGAVPTASTLPQLTAAGVTHVVNCRAVPQVWLSQDLAVERALFGPGRVVHAPMWDNGRPQPPWRWSAAALFAARLLAEDPAATVFAHCQHGRKRSVMLAYAVLRLLGHSTEAAARLITEHHPRARLLPAYQASVEHWLTAGAPPVGPLRLY